MMLAIATIVSMNVWNFHSTKKKQYAMRLEFIWIRSLFIHCNYTLDDLMRKWLLKCHTKSMFYWTENLILIGKTLLCLLFCIISIKFLNTPSTNFSIELSFKWFDQCINSKIKIKIQSIQSKKWNQANFSIKSNIPHGTQNKKSKKTQGYNN